MATFYQSYPPLTGKHGDYWCDTSNGFKWYQFVDGDWNTGPEIGKGLPDKDLIVANVITAGEITMERIVMGEYFESYDEWKQLNRFSRGGYVTGYAASPSYSKTPDLTSQLQEFWVDMERNRILQEELKTQLEVFQSKHEDEPTPILEAVIDGMTYEYLHHEKDKPYVVIELLTDLEYGIVDLTTNKIIKKVPLSKAEAIDLCKSWNAEVKPPHEHYFIKYTSPTVPEYWKCKRCEEIRRVEPYEEGVLVGYREHKSHMWYAATDDFGASGYGCECGEFRSDDPRHVLKANDIKDVYNTAKQYGMDCAVANRRLGNSPFRSVTLVLVSFAKQIMVMTLCIGILTGIIYGGVSLFDWIFG